MAENAVTDRGSIVYRVNGRDEIVAVNAEWDRFAADNAGEAVSSSQVLHRPLWDFIVDSTTRELYRHVLSRIRDGRALQFTFRCDSPDCRRLLEMTVQHGQENTVEFCTRTISEESRQPTSLPESSAAAPAELLRVCGWCKKVLVGGTWAEVEEAVAQLRLFHRPFAPSITHGICDRCHREMVRLLADTKARDPTSR